MHRIYESNKDSLSGLLKQAGAGVEGARLLIPDLQRPYRWSPSQVVALVDSLLRGWPFGTLLLWDLGEVRSSDKAELIPSRPFWSHVDRRGDEEHARDFARASLPTHLHMVLDGQQRLQSLLLAMWGDDCGFTLKDRDWIADMTGSTNERAREHWTRAQLHLDLDAFTEAYEGADGDPMKIEYQAHGAGQQGILAWARGSIDKGASPSRTAQQSIPLPDARPERYLRLSKLWSKAPDGPQNERQLKNELRALLEQHGFENDRLDRALEPLKAFVSWLGDLKKTEITFLRIAPPPSEPDAVKGYDEAVINVFTRLNSGGTPLTAQEILFAWFKRKWLPRKTGEKQADECFEGLVAKLNEKRFSVELDELVRGVSALWCACENDGRLLGTAEFRRGERMGDMAPWIATRWDRIGAVFLGAVEALEKVGLEQGRHFDSTNAVFLFFAWSFLWDEWWHGSGQKVLGAEAASRAGRESLEELAARWMLLPQWAGRWQRAESFSNYVAELSKLRKKLASLTNWEEARDEWRGLLTGWIDDTKKDAIASIETVHASSRNSVRRYHSLLWAWQFLDSERARLSSLVLTFESRKYQETHVDHVVAYNYWGQYLAPELGDDVDLDGLVDGPNALGNCLLLHANFNISKQDEPLAELLPNVFEFRQQPELEDAWTAALGLEDVLVDPRDSDVTEVRKAIARRTKRIREDLAAFVRGEKKLATARVQQATSDPAAAWVGEWDTTVTDAKGNSTKYRLILQQVDGQLAGSYKPDGTLEELSYDERKLWATWIEGGDRGGLTWSLTGTGRFEGTWGNGTHRRRKGHTWSGVRVSATGGVPDNASGG